MDGKRAAAGQGNAAPDRRETQAAREHAADERQFQADERETLADERERRADEREREADRREAALTERQRKADEREHDLDERGKERQQRQQAKFDRAAADTERGLAAWLVDPGKAIERAEALRTQAITAIEAFAMTEEEIARIHEQLAAARPGRRDEYRRTTEHAHAP